MTTDLPGESVAPSAATVSRWQLTSALLGDGLGATVTRSQAEERFRALVRAAELPSPRLNARFRGYEIDALWPDHRLAVEIDGFRFHAGRQAFEHDRVRDARLGAAGIEVLRFAWRRITRHPEAVAATLGRELATAGTAERG